jgi:hypothetical protein
MQVVGHQQIVAHQPCCGGVCPDVMKLALGGRLGEPALAFGGANGKKHPVGTAQRNTNLFRWRAPTHFAKGEIAMPRVVARACE